MPNTTNISICICNSITELTPVYHFSSVWCTSMTGDYIRLAHVLCFTTLCFASLLACLYICVCVFMYVPMLCCQPLDRDAKALLRLFLPRGRVSPPLPTNRKLQPPATPRMHRPCTIVISNIIYISRRRGPKINITKSDLPWCLKAASEIQYIRI